MTSSNCRIRLLTISFLTGLMGYGMPSIAQQIIPDNSMGTESSTITPNVPLGNSETNRIDGGAIRGNNVFHSFQEFNVNNGQQVHFANPAGIENIIGRVTGLNISEILGTLGVLGNGNLFLLNPNGFIFGPNAQLDVKGSFVASTSESLLLGNGVEFSATNPQAVPLLTVNVTPGLGDWLNTRAAIANQGNLNVGQDLTLVGKDLNLEGQLHAGGNLTLKATDTVQIRDSVTSPFIASADNQLLVQGNQLVDIFALNHPASIVSAGGDLILRSYNPVITDAYFYSGGNFRIEDLNGNLGKATSPNDPVIRASGDVSFSSYTGASLHIFAGGSVTADTIEITDADPNDGIQETVTLSDGITTVAIDGSVQPTLDIRSGTTNIEPRGIQGDIQGFSSTPDTNGVQNSADIKINQIINPGGLVFLSNQDRPNSELSGNIRVGLIDSSSDADGGSVFLDSRGGINVDQLIEVSGMGGNGGDVQLLADGDISLPVEAQVFSLGFGGIGGNITLKSKSAIQASSIESVTFGEGMGGDIKLTAPQIFVGDTSLTEPPESRGSIAAVLLGKGQGGNINVKADYLEINGGEIAVVTAGESMGDTGNLLINAEKISLKNNSFIAAVAVSSIGGNTGDINIQTKDLTLTDGSQISSQVLGIGNSGKVNINAKNSINLLGTFGFLPSAIVTDVFPDARGNGGAIVIQTGSITLSEGGQIRASTNGNGNAGSIFIDAKDITLDSGILLDPNPESVLVPSLIVSEVRPTATGDGNTIDITTEQLTVTNGALISASTQGRGNAGSINLRVAKSASFDGLFADENLEKPQPSGAFVGVLEGAIGQGGTLKITTPDLSVTNGAQLEALTEDSGNAGNIEILGTNTVLLSGSDTGLFSNTTATSTGNAGNVFVDSPLIEIKDGAVISVDSQGTGVGGSITMRGNKLSLDNQGRISATTASTDGGDIDLTMNDAILLRHESAIATDAGTAGAGGDGGNITITSPFIIAPPFENSDITANAFEGNGGNIDITTNELFGIEFRAKQTPRSDITASSEFGLAGIVAINNPDVDPTSGLVDLPDQTTDPSDRVIAGCAAAEGNSFTVTGRGGLPEDPTTTIRGQTILPDLRDFTELDTRKNLPPVKKQSRQQVPTSIVQVNGWVVNQDGEVELVAALPQEASLFKHPKCQDLRGK